MEFGRVPEKELKKIDFTLAREPLANKRFLTGKKNKQQKVYLGCAKWGRPEWVGKIYPPKTKEKDFLKHYVDHYNSIELNATHHKLYGPIAIANWGAKAKGKDFKFCPKMYAAVTHRGKLTGKNFLSNEFLRGVAAFKEHLGPVFVQVNELFSPGRKAELFDYLDSLPKDMQFFVEVRHPAWFAEEKHREEFFAKLTSLDMGAVITDTAGRRDCCHMHLTVRKTFIRFVGNSLHPTDYSRCDAWVKRIGYWLNHGLEEIYFFVHMHDEATSPELSVYMVDKLNAACKLDLIRPTFYVPEKSKALKLAPSRRSSLSRQRVP